MSLMVWALLFVSLPMYVPRCSTSGLEIQLTLPTLQGAESERAMMVRYLGGVSRQTIKNHGGIEVLISASALKTTGESQPRRRPRGTGVLRDMLKDTFECRVTTHPSSPSQ